MTLVEGLTILALIAGPIAAVRIQRRLDIQREERGRKLWVFKTLMAYRAAALTPEYVQALNGIDLEFAGDEYRAVTTAWKTHLDHLSSYPKDNPAMEPVWTERNVALQVGLLLAMGKSLGFDFDEVQIKKGIYFPEAHGTIDTEIKLIRRGIVRLLFGDATLKMEVTKLPVTEAQAEAQQRLTEALMKVAQQAADKKPAARRWSGNSISGNGATPTTSESGALDPGPRTDWSVRNRRRDFTPWPFRAGRACLRIDPAVPAAAREYAPFRIEQWKEEDLGRVGMLNARNTTAAGHPARRRPAWPTCRCAGTEVPPGTSTGMGQRPCQDAGS